MFGILSAVTVNRKAAELLTEEKWREPFYITSWPW